MVWQTFPGLKGKIYVPESGGKKKKHPCPDCSVCQQCSQERCRVCRNQAPVDNRSGCVTHDTNKKVTP
jgi:hypothetical protein